MFQNSIKQPKKIKQVGYGWWIWGITWLFSDQRSIPFLGMAPGRRWWSSSPTCAYWRWIWLQTSLGLARRWDGDTTGLGTPKVSCEGELWSLGCVSKYGSMTPWIICVLTAVALASVDFRLRPFPPKSQQLELDERSQRFFWQQTPFWCESHCIRLICLAPTYFIFQFWASLLGMMNPNCWVNFWNWTRRSQLDSTH